MVKQHDFIERTLISVKRQYSKDEAVAALIKQVGERDIEIGKLKSEIEFLNEELNNQRAETEVNREARVQARKEEKYKHQSAEIKFLREQNRNLTILRDKLFHEKLTKSHP